MQTTSSSAASTFVVRIHSGTQRSAGNTPESTHQASNESTSRDACAKAASPTTHCTSLPTSSWLASSPDLHPPRPLCLASAPESEVSGVATAAESAAMGNGLASALAPLLKPQAVARAPNTSGKPKTAATVQVDASSAASCSMAVCSASVIVSCCR